MAKIAHGNSRKRANDESLIPIADYVRSLAPVETMQEIPRYDALFAMIETGKLTPAKLIGRTNPLQQSIDALMNMDKFEVAGVTVVTEF